MGLDPCLGVPHTSDLFFLFGNFDFLLSPDEVALGQRMREYWKRFAVDPHRIGGPWPMWGTAGARRYLSLNTRFDVASAQWKQQQCDAIDDIRIGGTAARNRARG